MPGSSTSITAAGIAQDTIEDEEDTSRGDLMDFLTPRDISSMRYIQHHEWMEEVFSSAYSTGQIIPVGLGLGRKGELEELTKGFFEAPTSPVSKAHGGDGAAPVGKMEAGRAEDFTRRATDKIAQTNAEIERLKRQHAKRMAKITRGAVVKEAEIRLRSAVTNPADTGTEIWRLEGRLEDPAEVGNGEASAAASMRREKVDDIVKEVEAAVGKRVEAIKDLLCVQKGGLEERAMGNTDSHDNHNPTDAFSGGQAGDDEDIDMETSSPNVREQSVLSTATPARDIQAPRELASDHHDTPAVEGTISQVEPLPRPASGIDDRAEPIPTDQEISANADMDVDLDMPGVANDYGPGSGDGETGDWVMVHKGGEDTAQLGGGLEQGTSVEEHTLGQQNIDTPGVFVNTPGSGLQGFTPQERGSGHEDLITTDFGQFGELDSAGDALAGYEGQDEDGDVGLDEHGDLGIDTSAFGDALHGTVGHGDLPTATRPDEGSS